MKNVFSISLLLILISINLKAQSKNENYKFKEDISIKLEKDTVPWKYQSAAVDFSITGNYRKALQTWDMQGANKAILSANDSLYFNKFRATNAKDYIIKRSKKEKLIIINEAHNNSRHRVFTTSLLKDLYKNGYRYLGI